MPSIGGMLPQSHCGDEFSKCILENSKEIKRMLQKFSPSIFICICRLFLSRTRIKSTKMQNSNVTISKHIKLHANLAQASQL